MLRIGRDLFGGFRIGAALAVLCLAMAGCSKTQNPQQALDSQIESLHLQKEPLGQFAGKVTIDSQPPAVPKGKALVVILYDQKNPEKPVQYTICGNDGRFSFYTYSTADGVRVGSYVVLFAELTATRRSGLRAPDELKNLYNDPDKNAQNKDFVVTVAAPGKTDYEFNLQVAGKEPATPGPHTVAELRKD
jgi:hypothetical protein